MENTASQASTTSGSQTEETKSKCQSDRYYEAHITVEASSEISFEDFAEAAHRNDWRASKFDVDEVDDMSGKWFVSSCDKDLNEIKSNVSDAIDGIEYMGLKILRWKIEDTILDSKLGDVL